MPLTYNATLKLRRSIAARPLLTSCANRRRTRQEPGFSFAVRDFQNVDMAVESWSDIPIRRPNKWSGRSPAFSFRYYNPRNPRYILHWKNDALTVAEKRY